MGSRGCDADNIQPNAKVEVGRNLNDKTCISWILLWHDFLMDSFKIFQEFGWFSDRQKITRWSSFFRRWIRSPNALCAAMSPGNLWQLLDPATDENLRSRPSSDSGGLCQGQNPWMARLFGEAVVVAGEWRMAMRRRLWRRFGDVLVAVFPGGSCEYGSESGGDTQYLSMKWECDEKWWDVVSCCIAIGWKILFVDVVCHLGRWTYRQLSVMWNTWEEFRPSPVFVPAPWLQTVVIGVPFGRLFLM